MRPELYLCVLCGQEPPSTFPCAPCVPWFKSKTDVAFVCLYIWGDSLRVPDEPTTRNRHAKGKTNMKLNHEKHGPHGNKVIGQPVGLPLNALKPASRDAKGSESFRLPCGAEHEKPPKPAKPDTKTPRPSVNFSVGRKAGSVCSVAKGNPPPYSVPPCAPWLFQTAAPNLRLRRVPLATRTSPNWKTMRSAAERNRRASQSNV